jgi:hypothetical protein
MQAGLAINTYGKGLLLSIFVGFFVCFLCQGYLVFFQINWWRKTSGSLIVHYFSLKLAPE